MSKLLYSQSTQAIKPYPRLDDNPIAGLDPDYLVLEKVDVAPISYDSETQSLSFTYVVDLQTLQYRQEWTVNDLPPTPDWDGFNTYMLTDTDFNTYYGTGLTVAPAVTTSIPTALAQVSTNDVNSFNLTFNGFCNAVSVTATHRNGWADVAESYHLPADFVSVIRGGN